MIFYLKLYRSSIARSSMNNILKKIPRARREKQNMVEDMNMLDKVSQFSNFEFTLINLGSRKQLVANDDAPNNEIFLYF